MLMFTDYVEKIHSAILKEIPDFSMSELVVGQPGHGDISARLIRYLIKKENSLIISERISKDIKNLDFVQDATLENNYLNIRIRPSFIFNAIKETIDATGAFPDVFQDPERVSVEHTSTNPTGPLHIGRARNSVIGDSLARLKKRVGYRVTTQYYVNDSGKQMMSLYLGYEKFHKGEKPTVELLLDGYIKTYKYFEEVGSEKEVEDLMERYERNDADLISSVRKIAAIMLDGISRDLSTIGIKVDDYTWESAFMITGETGVVMQKLSPYLHDEDGAKYVDIPGLRKVFVQRGNGTSLYVTRDIAYHMYKFSQYDQCMVVLGEDHKEHTKSLAYIMKELLGYNNELSFVFYAYVNLESGKMSTRQGNSIPMISVYERLREKSLEELKKRYGEEADPSTADKMASSSFRYHLLKYNPSKPITFRWEDALDFNGETALFIMYSMVRASSILKKVETSVNEISMEGISESEKELLLNLYLYPYRLTEASRNSKPEIIANYAYQLASKFTTFYESTKISEQPESIKKRQLELVNFFLKILEDSCEIIGIQKVEKL